MNDVVSTTEYQQLDLNLMVDVIENHLDDLLLFTGHILKCAGENS